MRALLGALLLSALSLGAAGGAPAQSRAVSVDPRRCTTIGDAVAGALPAAFTKYRAFTKACGVGLDPKKPVLLLVAVWEDDYYTAQPGTPQAEEIPPPQLITPQGASLGALPLSFPGEGPLTVTVRFTDWRRDWPHEIRVTAATAAAGDPPRVGPLKWDTAEKRFIQR